jgi:hypothetical protein
MDVVPSIFLSSLAGAILFFTGGRLSARGAPPPGDDGALAAEREARARAEQEAATQREAAERAHRAAEQAREEHARVRDEAERGHAAATRALAAAEARAADGARAVEVEGRTRREAETAAQRREALARQELDRAQRERAAAHAQIEQARAALAAVEERAGAAERRAGAADTRASAAEAHARAAEARATQAEGRLAPIEARAADADRLRAAAEARAARAEGRLVAAEARAAEADRLRAENAQLCAARAVAPPERASATDLAELQRRNVELTMRARVIDQRTGEMERAQAENAELRARVEALAEAAREAEELRRRVADLTAQGFAQRLADPAPPSRPPPEGASLATVLERELDRLVEREPGARLAILADPRGLLIASSVGASYPHEIAAASSLTIHVSDRIRELMPLGPPASLELYDENGLCMRTRWLRFETETFLVSTVGVIDPDDAEAADLRSRLGELIGR